MSLAPNIQEWRLSKRQSVAAVAGKAGLVVEASLRSLAKQAKQPTVPWQSRPPGHFEPPND